MDNQGLQQPQPAETSSAIIIVIYFVSLLVVAGLVYSITSYLNTSQTDRFLTGKGILPVPLSEKPVENLELIYTFSGQVNNFDPTNSTFTLEDQPSSPDRFVITDVTHVSVNSGIKNSPYKEGDIVNGENVKVRAVYSTKDKAWRVTNIFLTRNALQKLDDK